MIRVCHMASSHRERDTRIFYKECRSLASAGYEVYEVIPTGESFEENGVHVISIGPRPASRFKRIFVMLHTIYKTALSLDADIYHIHDFQLLFFALKLKRKNKVVIFDSHEFHDSRIKSIPWLPVIFGSLAQWAYSKYQAYVLRRLDYVIGVTPHMCDGFRQKGIAAELIMNFPNIFDNSDFQSPMFVERNIVFAGGIVKKWSHGKILQAIYEIKDVNYILCGGARIGSYLDNLKQQDGWEQVEYLGLLPHTQLPNVLCKGNIGMALCSYELSSAGGKRGTLGNTKLFEYMMAGLPVICTDFILWKEIIDEYQCGICVNPNEIDEIKRAINYLLNNPNEAKRMGENGRRAVLTRFNWKVEEKKLLRLYEMLIKVD